MIDVSIILLTYNQDRFVQQALNSIFSQIYSIEVEIIVGDDHSNDQTINIINNYLVNTRDVVNLYSNTNNLGLARNYEKAVKLAKGKYIVYLEGDDYWTDPLKLQKQFDFLEANRRFVLSFHDFLTIDTDNNIISDKNLFNISLQKNRSRKDMVTGCLIHQNTMMFRNIVKKIPFGFFAAKNHDTFFIAYLSKWGEAGYVKCQPLYYRIHGDSLWSSLSGKRKHLNNLITYLIILFYVPPRYFGNVIWKLGSKIKSLINT